MVSLTVTYNWDICAIVVDEQGAFRGLAAQSAVVVAEVKCEVVVDHIDEVVDRAWVVGAGGRHADCLSSFTWSVFAVLDMSQAVEFVCLSMS
jgi:hypothetical protein